MKTARFYARAYKYNVNKIQVEHNMLVESKSMRKNGEDKIYTFADGSELQVRPITNDWRLFK